MAEPYIKPRLESKFFTNNGQPTQGALDACLASDPAHIMRGVSKGQHVVIIQEALKEIAKKFPDMALPAITDAIGDFQQTTFDAVLKFKTYQVIKREGRAVDGVVGRMTISALDDFMLTIERPEPKPDPKPAPAPVGRTQDIYIRIFGYDSPGQAGADFSKSPGAIDAQNRMHKNEGYLDLHVGLITIWFVGGAQSVVDETVRRVSDAFTKRPPGRVVMIGGSAGGKNVLQIAEKLAANSVAMHYVGVCDGAFQKEDKQNPAQDSVTALPLVFKSPNFSVVQNRKRNWFQSWGHTLDPNQELHGKITGFSDDDLTDSPEVKTVRDAFNNGAGWGTENSRKQKALEAAHTAAYLKGFNIGLTEMRNVMISDLPKPK